jgi:hypothetical protein
MTREIKFRVWDKQNKLWVAGWGIGQSGVQSDVGSKVFMQYTGLTDKNGKEIYEGDIVQFEALLDGEKKGKARVFFQDGSFIANGLMNNQIPLEVIGNIYENPELLN